MCACVFLKFTSLKFFGDDYSDGKNKIHLKVELKMKQGGIVARNRFWTESKMNLQTRESVSSFKKQNDYLLLAITNILDGMVK